MDQESTTRSAPLCLHLYRSNCQIVLRQLDTTENITVILSSGKLFTSNPEPLRTHLVELFAFANMAALMTQQVIDLQRYSGERFDYYRRGMPFDANARHMPGQIAGRPLPYHNIINAYNVVYNQMYTNVRNNDLAAGVFNRVAEPRFDVRRARARRNQNDMTQALTDFMLRDLNWGLRFGRRLLKCQLKSQEYMNILFQYY